MKALFLVGRPPVSINVGKFQEKLKYEQEEHCDILQFDFVESLLNNTLKQLHAIHYLYKTFSGGIYQLPEYIFRMDDDVFVNVPRIANLLRDPDTKFRLVL